MTVRVAVTGAGGPSAVSFMKAVEPHGAELFVGDIDPYAAGLYLVPPGRRWILHRGSDPRFADHLLERCVEAKIDVLVPTIDVELLPLAHRRADFEAAGIKLILSPATTFERCLDKWKLIETCAEVCPVPTTVIVDREFALAPGAPPLLIKPRRGVGARDVRVVQSADDLANVPRDESYVAQEYLTGAEYSVDVLCDTKGEVLAVVPRSRLKIESGVAVAGRTIRDDTLAGHAAAVARRLGIVFVANIQFREDASGTPKLLDVNARFPGTMPLTVISGIDMPSLALDLVLGKSVDATSLSYREVALVRTWQDHLVETSEIADLERRARDLGPA